MDVADVSGGGTPSTRNSIFWNGNINWFTPTEVGKTKYLFNSLRKITEIGLNNCSAKILPAGTILMTTRAGIGDLGILKFPSATNQGFQSLIPLENADGEFLFYLASTLKPVLLQNASGSTFLEISPSKVKSIQIPLPPLPEQQAIAEVLSDTDNWIESLEKLIAKKQLIKQGAMQQLLTPKEDWEVKKLGEVCEIVMGQSPLSQFYNQKELGLPLIQGNADIENRKTIIRNFTSQITKKGYVNDTIMSVRAPVGEIAKATFDCCLGRGVCALRYCNNFLYHYMIFVENQWHTFSTGSTFDSVNSGQIIDFEINIPKSLSEQTQIATILSDMDTEIETLKQKLAKAKQIKQGLMQELLTGRIRLA